MDIEFNSIEDLYKKVLPALKIKKREMKKKGIEKSEIDIFNHLIQTKWSKMVNLSLNEIVNDILNYQNSIF